MGLRPYQAERAKSPLGQVQGKGHDNSVLLPRKGANVYSDNGFLRNHNQFSKRHSQTPMKQGSIKTDDSKSVSELEYQESAYLTAKS